MAIFIHVHCKHQTHRFLLNLFSFRIIGLFYIQFVSVYHHRPNASSDLGVILPPLISALSCLLFQVFLLCLCFGSSLGDHNGSLGLINYKLYTARSYLKNIPWENRLRLLKFFEIEMVTWNSMCFVSRANETNYTGFCRVE